MAAKRCPRCQETKPLEAFQDCRTSRTGRQVYCRPCAADVQREYLSRNKEIVALRRANRTLEFLKNPGAGTKECNKCHETKPKLEFYQHRTTKDGRFPACKECEKAAAAIRRSRNIERMKQYNAARYAADPKRSHRDNRAYKLSLYGLTIEQYDAMAEAQNHKCAICLLPERYIDPRSGDPRRLAVDHDHETLKVRGLLCGRCNRSIGQFADDHDRLDRAAAYLRRALDGQEQST